MYISPEEDQKIREYWKKQMSEYPLLAKQFPTIDHSSNVVSNYARHSGRHDHVMCKNCGSQVRMGNYHVHLNTAQCAMTCNRIQAIKEGYSMIWTWDTMAQEPWAAPFMKKFDTGEPRVGSHTPTQQTWTVHWFGQCLKILLRHYPIERSWAGTDPDCTYGYGRLKTFHTYHPTLVEYATQLCEAHLKQDQVALDATIAGIEMLDDGGYDD